MRGGTRTVRANVLRQPFQSTRPLRGGTAEGSNALHPAGFQSTRPLRGGTACKTMCAAAKSYFNPPAPCGAGLPLRQQPWGILRFQSTRPLRGGTCGVRGAGWLPGHFNPPAPCGAGPRTTAYQITQIYFNPPAPCGAGPERWPWCRRCRDFNPPAPCGAGPSRPLCSHPASQFQSTRPLRGGTAHCACQRFAVTDFNPPALDMGAAGRSNFNPPAPCGAGQFFWGLLGTALQFQSTRPVLLSMTHATFQSTRPLRGGTAHLPHVSLGNQISIHPPLAGRDPPQNPRSPAPAHFNPPAPCGAGQVPPYT